ncbi:MAG: aspartate kinase [Eubacterium sp.]|nr:aspartate kinase [Eubacterium sp.]
MGLKVAKFGGSSVADGIQLEKMRKIIMHDPDRRYVVVSAPGKRFDGDNKITDLLFLCLTQMENNIPCDQIFQVICDRFTAVKLNLDLDIDLTEDFDEIRERMRNGAPKDYVVSRGEYLSAKIAACYLGYDFVDTEGLIIFDKRGRVKLDETDARLSEELAKHERAVLPGFYGTNEETGEVRTFSRGGSDITGALVARAVKADVYENWTDVSGFLMADPRIVKGAKPIGNISYMELRELSYMGASVLHEDAIYPVRLAGIPINIRNTNHPEDQGTVITAEHDPEDKRVITGIAGNRDFTVIAIYKNTLNKEIGFVRRLLSIIEDHRINFEHIPTGIDTVSIIISNKEIEGKLDDVLEDINLQLKPDNIDVYTDISLIATVGCGMSFRPGVSAMLFSALAKNDINIRMIDQGSSEMNIIIGVANKDFESAIRTIYEAFNE